MTDSKLDQNMRHHPHVSDVHPFVKLALGLVSSSFGENYRALAESVVDAQPPF
jgi:hypothetical protein